MSQNSKTFFITGGGGYLGSVLVPMLLDLGHSVKVLDRFYWGQNIFDNYLSEHDINKSKLLLIEGDSRTYTGGLLENVDILIDLAALSNDPIGELNPQRTLEINYKARVRTATLAKSKGVKKYLLASSCSVYGFRDELLTEESPKSPVTTYAKASSLTEQGTLKLADDNFSVTALRLGTLYGLSPRMRFDIVLNTMVLSLFKHQMIAVQGGQQWRPILHVRDAARAFINIAEAESFSDLETNNGRIFNVGSNDQNYQMHTLAKIITETINPDAQIIVQEAQTDFRSYKVSFERIQKMLGYSTEFTPQHAAQEIFEKLQNHSLIDTIQTKTIDWYKHLLAQNPTILDTDGF